MGPWLDGLPREESSSLEREKLRKGFRSKEAVGKATEAQTE
jgi:hypothetical protein